MEQENEDENEIVSVFNDFEKFQMQFNKLKEQRKNFAIVCNSSKSSGSSVWKHFGKLHFKNQLIFKDLNFCYECFYPPKSKNVSAEVTQPSTSKKKSTAEKEALSERQPTFKRYRFFYF